MYKNFILYTSAVIFGAGVCVTALTFTYNQSKPDSDISSELSNDLNTNLKLNNSFYKSEQIKAKTESENTSVIIASDVHDFIVNEYEDLLDIKALKEITPNANISYTIEPFKSENNYFWGQLNIIVNEIPEALYFAGEFDDAGINACLQLEQENNYTCMCNYLNTFSDSLITNDALKTICL